MTDSKLRNSDLAYSICFSQVLFKLFTFQTYHFSRADNVVSKIS